VTPTTPPDPQAPNKPFPIRLDLVVVVLVIGYAVLSIWDDNAGGLLEVGAVAPDFELVHHQGGRVKLSDYQGKVVVLDFWATWCPPCVEEMPWLVETTQYFKEGGVVLLAASHDEPGERPAAITKFLERIPQLGPHVVYGEPTVGKKYGVVALPTLYIIGRNGKIVARARGAVDPEKVRKWIAEASAAR
jgi:peroxiredoxin